MELRQIKYFIEVAKREHMTEAANALHVAQSAVSRQIFNLEKELGVDLFIREGRNVKLTPIGKVFLEHMEKAVHVIDHATRVLEEYTDPERGMIHIGCTSSRASYILPTAISQFRAEYPHVKFQLHHGSSNELEDAVIQGAMNMALVGPVPTEVKKLKGSILFTENIVALLPKDHPMSEFQSIRLRDLRNEAFVLFPMGYVLREMIMTICQQMGFTPKVAFEGEDVDTIKGLVSAGLGVSLIPESTLVDNIPRGTVKVSVTQPDVTRTVGVITPVERELLPTEKLFYNFLLEFFKRLEQFQS